MRSVLAVSAAAVLALAAAPNASAWGARGHQVVAYIAYVHLNPGVRRHADQLVQRNPCFAEWTTQVRSLPATQRSAALFMLAATWSDLIKLTPSGTFKGYDCQPGFTFDSTDGAIGPDGNFSGDIAPDIPEASQNIGYLQDHRRHKYWHFIDTPLALDGAPTQPTGKVNLVTEINLLAAAIASNEPANLASYDLVWLEHLTGDIHQPLHATQRFTRNFPNGDQGGNLVKICAGGQACHAELHAFWDNLPGSAASISATITGAKKVNAQPGPTPAEVDVSHPERWAADAFTLAQQTAYAPPFDTDVQVVDPSQITADYQNKAMAVANSQLLLGGYRLAALLNANLAPASANQRRVAQRQHHAAT